MGPGRPLEKINPQAESFSSCISGARVRLSVTGCVYIRQIIYYTTKCKKKKRRAGSVRVRREAVIDVLPIPFTGAGIAKDVDMAGGVVVGGLVGLLGSAAARWWNARPSGRVRGAEWPGRSLLDRDRVHLAPPKLEEIRPRVRHLSEPLHRRIVTRQ